MADPKNRAGHLFFDIKNIIFINFSCKFQNYFVTLHPKSVKEKRIQFV